MPPHSNILAWKIPWAEEPGALQPMGCKESETTELLNTHTVSDSMGKLRRKIFWKIFQFQRLLM